MSKITLRNRLIAFFDTLGFSNALKTKRLDDLYHAYAGFIDEANYHAFNPKGMTGSPNPPEPNFDIARFVFDSVVLVSKPTEDGRNYSNFILATTLLMELAIKNNFPLRGCIGFGDFLDDPSRGIFLSKTWPDVVRAEGAQEWTGAFILPQIAQTLVMELTGSPEPEITNSSVLIPYRIPFKEGFKFPELEEIPENLWCLNWPSMMSIREKRDAIRFLIEPKRANTQAFVEHVDALPDKSQLLQKEYYPATRLRTMATRYAAKIKFENDEGESVEPGVKQWNISFDAEL